MYQIVKYHVANGQQIKSVLCLDGEFHLDKHVGSKVGMTRKTWKTIGGADRWLAERSNMNAKVQMV